MMDSNRIYKGKRVLVTGHNGFKGSWLTIWLQKLGAEVVGFSLEECENDYIYKHARLGESLFADEKRDVGDFSKVKEVFDEHQPEMVFHLAAQPLVRLSYELPLDTLRTNIMGTAHVMDCIKETPSVRCGVIITTDKCYKNKEKKEGYKETDELGGYDPYSASKACAELIVNAYRCSFFGHMDKAVASVRAGNVVGGGDFSKDRLIPDCIKDLRAGRPIRIRNPPHVRPWQHVLEPLYGYLLVGQKLLEGNKDFADAWNFGPDKESYVPVKEVADLMIRYWGDGEWMDISDSNEKRHETTLLTLDITKAKEKLGWKPIWQIDKTIQMTTEWYKRMMKKTFSDCVPDK